MFRFFLYIMFLLVAFPNIVYGSQFSFFKGSVEDTTLTCSIDSFDKQKRIEYSLKWLDKNNKIEHKLLDKSASLENYQTKFLIENKYSGRINVYNKKNIIWTYEKFIKYNAPLGKPREDRIKIKNIYHLKTNKYFIDIQRGSYTLVSAQGKCELNRSNPKKVSIAKVKKAVKKETKINKLSENDVAYYTENLSPDCNFVFSNYFKKFIKIQDNNATFFINKNNPSVSFTTTNELEVSIQIVVKKINNPKSPTITLFMAQEKGKNFGNFIIPNLRQNFCNGKFKPFNLYKNNLIANNSQTPATNLQDKIEKGQEPKKVNIVEETEAKAKKIAEEEAKRKAEEKARKIAEEEAKRKAEAKAKKIAEEEAKRKAEEKAKKIAEEEAKRKAEAKAKKIAEEEAKRKAEAKAKKIAEEEAKRKAEAKAKKIAEEKAKRKAEEKAKKIAEEEAKRKAEAKAKKLAEEKAKREIRVSKISEKYYQTMVSMKDIFNIGEAYIKNHSKVNELNEIKVKLDEYLNKPIEEYEFFKKEKYAKLHVEYTSLLFKFYNEELKLGRIPNQNDFINALERYISNQKKYLNNYKVKFQNKFIIEDFMDKFSVNDWPNDIEKILNKIEKLNILNNNMISAAKSNDVWNKFIYPSNIHIKKLKIFELEMENWINQSTEKFKSYYNKRLYDLSVQKNLNQIKEKQDKEEDFFNKIGN